MVTKKCNPLYIKALEDGACNQKKIKWLQELCKKMLTLSFVCGMMFL